MVDTTRIRGAVRGLALVALMTLASACSQKAKAPEPNLLPGMAQLSGKVTGLKPGLLTTVHALNTDKNINTMVFVVDGEYLAVNLFPGNYEVTVQPAVGQVFTDGFEVQTVKLHIESGQRAVQDFALKDQTWGPDYVGGMDYTSGWSDAIGDFWDTPPSPVAKVLPYEKIYPPGRGRELLENICMGCHTVQLFPYNHDRRYASGRPVKDRAAWAATVDRMHKNLPFGKAPNFDEDLLSPEDREILIDYLAANFGPDSEPRVVQLESEPELDEKALAKAQYVEYRFPNHEKLPKRATHTLSFTLDGKVWAMDRAGALVLLDPATGEYEEFIGHGGGESLVADKDGTVWYGGLRHFDPKLQKHDDYKLDSPAGPVSMGISTMIFDSNGDQWLSFLTTGRIGKWDRKTDQVLWWDVPIYRSRPYGITVDGKDRVWFAQYHNSALGMFDPKTQKFTNYPITPYRPTNIRRASADSKDMIWTATWGSKGMQNGALYKLNPETGEVKEWHLGIPYSNPYDAAPDSEDNIWIATDNYIVMFDQNTEKFTRYPLPVRSDVPRLSITGEGAVWFALRNAGHAGGHGGTAVALYPDKYNIKTYSATYAPDSHHSKLLKYDGPMTPVLGATKVSPGEPQNPGEYEEMLKRERPEAYKAYLEWKKKQAGASQSLGGRFGEAVE
jgi:streptogramin lyase